MSRDSSDDGSFVHVTPIESDDDGGSGPMVNHANRPALAVSHPITIQVMSRADFERERSKIQPHMVTRRALTSSVPSPEKRGATLGNNEFAVELDNRGNYPLNLHLCWFAPIPLKTSNPEQELLEDIKTVCDDKRRFCARERFRRALAEFFVPQQSDPFVWVDMGIKYFPGNDITLYHKVLSQWTGEFLGLYSDALTPHQVIDALREFYDYPALQH